MYKVIINKSQILLETEKALLVKIPKENNRRFFFPKKLVNKYGKRYILSIPENFEFTILSGNKELSRTIEEAEDITNKFQLLENSNLLAEKVKEHVPDKINPIERVVEDEFIR